MAARGMRNLEGRPAFRVPRGLWDGWRGNRGLTLIETVSHHDLATPIQLILKLRRLTMMMMRFVRQAVQNQQVCQQCCQRLSGRGDWFVKSPVAVGAREIEYVRQYETVRFEVYRFKDQS